jgi:hypothetical protein
MIRHEIEMVGRVLPRQRKLNRLGCLRNRQGAVSSGSVFVMTHRRRDMVRLCEVDDTGVSETESLVAEMERVSKT